MEDLIVVLGVWGLLPSRFWTFFRGFCVALFLSEFNEKEVFDFILSVIWYFIVIF